MMKSGKLNFKETFPAITRQLLNLRSGQILSNIHNSWYSFKFDWIPMDWFPILNKSLADLFVDYIKRGLFIKPALRALVNFLYDESNVILVL
jgi:hypothetical protein